MTDRPAPEALDQLDQAVARLAVARRLLDSDEMAAYRDRQQTAIAAGEAEPRLHQLLLRERRIDAGQLVDLMLDAQREQLAETTLLGGGRDDVDDPRPGDVLGHYRIVRQLAMGGMGVVYQAVDCRLERPVCLKLMRGEGGETLRARFEREARSGSRLQHPGIVRIVGVEQLGPRDVLVMDLVEGWTLDEYVASQRPSQAWVLHAFDELLQAVEYMHEQGVVHRDLKPANIVVTPEGRPRIIDFSLAKLTGDVPQVTLTRAGQPIGTPLYMPPEQIKGDGPMGPPADVYALGVILYELLTGAVPFDADSATALYALVLHATPRSPRERVPTLPRGLSDAVMCAIARDPAARFASAAAMRRALAEPALRRRPPRALAVAALLGVVTLAGLLAGLGRGRSAPVVSPPARPEPPVQTAPTPPAPPSAADLQRQLAAALLARYERGGRPDDLRAAVRLDATHAPALRKGLHRWRTAGMRQEVADALVLLLEQRALPATEARKQILAELDITVAWQLVDDALALGRRIRRAAPRLAERLETELGEALVAQTRDPQSAHGERAVLRYLVLVGGQPGLGWARNLVALGRDRIQRRAFRGAARLLGVVGRLQADPPIVGHDWRFHYARGLARQALRRHAQAIDDFAQAHRLSGNRPAALHRAVSLLLLDRHDEALRPLRMLRGKSGPYDHVIELLIPVTELLASPSETTREAVRRQLVKSRVYNILNTLQSPYPAAVELWQRVRAELGPLARIEAELGLTLVELYDRRARAHLDRALAATLPKILRARCRQELERLELVAPGP